MIATLITRDGFTKTMQIPNPGRYVHTVVESRLAPWFTDTPAEAIYDAVNVRHYKRTFARVNEYSNIFEEIEYSK